MLHPWKVLGLTIKWEEVVYVIHESEVESINGVAAIMKTFDFYWV